MHIHQLTYRDCESTCSKDQDVTCSQDQDQDVTCSEEINHSMEDGLLESLFMPIFGMLESVSRLLSSLSIDGESYASSETLHLDINLLTSISTDIIRHLLSVETRSEQHQTLRIKLISTAQMRVWVLIAAIRSLHRGEKRLISPNRDILRGLINCLVRSRKETEETVTCITCKKTCITCTCKVVGSEPGLIDVTCSQDQDQDVVGSEPGLIDVWDAWIGGRGEDELLRIVECPLPSQGGRQRKKKKVLDL